MGPSLPTKLLLSNEMEIMGITKVSRRHIPLISAWLFLWIALLGVQDASAQFKLTWVDVGEFQSQYNSSGAQDELEIGNTGYQWPAIMDWSDHVNAKGLWIGVKDWTDAKDKHWNHFVNRIGLRGPGEGLAFPVKHELVSRLGSDGNPVESQPRVFVEGMQTFDKVALVDRVDPNLKADRMLHTVTNTKVGVTMDRKVYAFSQEYHDDYHIIEYTYTNTGNVDADEEIELEGQTLNDVLIGRAQRVTGNKLDAWVAGGGGVWGKYNMIDVVGDGHEEYDVDFRAYYVWHGYNSEVTKFNNLGGPLWEDGAWYVAEGDSVGRLAGGDMVGRVTIFGEKAGNEGQYDAANSFPPNPADDANDVSQGTYDDPELRQPYVMGWQDADGRMAARGEPMEDYYNIALMANGPKQGTYPHWADVVEEGQDGNFATTENDASGGFQGGHLPVLTYGPYDLEYGESVRIVVADAVHGLDWEAQVEIGKAYKRSGGDDSLKIAYDANSDGKVGADEEMTKNEWVLSSRDSLNKIYQKAIDNYWSGFEIPQAPLPPKEFHVSGKPGRAELRWTTYGDAGSIDGWEIYRTSKRVDNMPYTKIAGIEEVGPGVRSFDDETLQRGINYFYYIQAVGPKTSTEGPAGTPQGERLKSGRYYAQTYAPVQLKRPAGTLETFRIVPNPFNLGADPNIRWPDQEDKLGFLDVPGQCTIKIYTELGELVTTLEHTDGSGDEFWNMTTESRQMLVSGIYIAVVENTETGEIQQRQFTVIR